MTLLYRAWSMHILAYILYGINESWLRWPMHAFCFVYQTMPMWGTHMCLTNAVFTHVWTKSYFDWVWYLKIHRLNNYVSTYFNRSGAMTEQIDFIWNFFATVYINRGHWLCTWKHRETKNLLQKVFISGLKKSFGAARWGKIDRRPAIFSFKTSDFFSFFPSLFASSRANDVRREEEKGNERTTDRTNELKPKAERSAFSYVHTH